MPVVLVVSDTSRVGFRGMVSQTPDAGRCNLSPFLFRPFCSKRASTCVDMQAETARAKCFMCVSNTSATDGKIQRNKVESRNDILCKKNPEEESTWAKVGQKKEEE